MKTIKTFSLLTLTIILNNPCSNGQDVIENSLDEKTDFPVLYGSYLGQKPPGHTPEIFAPGIVSTELHEHSIPSFSPDGKQLLWSSQFRDDGGFPTRVIESKIKNGKWTEPDFFKAITFENSSSAFFAPDGKRIYFTSTSEGTDKEKSYEGYDIWYIENSDSTWSSPKNLGLPINSINLETYATLTRDMTLYFMGEIDPEKYLYGIYRSEFTDGIYQTPELLPENINTEYLDWTPFISPDESYLLFSSNRPGGYGNGDLYISYRNSDNTWTDPVNLGPSINDDSQERFPCVSPDGKYLFYVSNKFGRDLTSGSSHSLKFYMEIMNKPGNGFNDIYWVDAGFIEALRPKN